MANLVGVQGTPGIIADYSGMTTRIQKLCGCVDIVEKTLCLGIATKTMC